jgi:hypothetical protein
MGYNIDKLEKLLNNIEHDSKKIDENLHYDMMNERYKSLISGYSLAYLEMSDFYYGEELPYDTYCKEFKKNNNKLFDLKGTYLESRKDLIELYKLFIFYGFLEYYMGK